MTQKNYRHDIDGLRAIAVLSIVLFHLDHRWMPGGFVGVDIFFVISGYLISGIIYRQRQVFSFADFYARRALRILPALTAVLLITLVLSFWMLYPHERVAYSKSAIAASMFVGNIHFYEVLNYFSPNADEIPLLHLWSLGVEEQFYFFFPFLILLGSRLFGKAGIAKDNNKNQESTDARPLHWLLGLLALVSLVASVWMLMVNPPAAFYLIFFRAFELLIGSVLALGIARAPRTGKRANLLFVMGAMILVCVLAGYSQSMAFPGMAALLPCIATALMIIAGDRSKQVPQDDISAFRLGRILSMPVFRYVGRISFSLYLVHWPVIVFGRRLFPQASPLSFALLALILSLLLAACSYHAIEQPFRKLRQAVRPKRILCWALLSIAVVSSINLFVVFKHGFPDRSDARINKIYSYGASYDFKTAFHSRTCFLDPDQVASQVNLEACLPPPGKSDVILWGDSHSAHLADAMRDGWQRENKSFGFIAASACPPALGFNPAVRPQCQSFNDEAIQIILKHRPKLLILSAVWHFDDPAIKQGLDKTLSLLHEHGIQTVILGNSPIYRHSIPIMIAERLKANNQQMLTSDGLEMSLLTSTEDVFRKNYAHRNGVRYISVMDQFCPGMRCPLITPDETPVHFDSEHFTYAGATMLMKNLMPELSAELARSKP